VELAEEFMLEDLRRGQLLVNSFAAPIPQPGVFARMRLLLLVKKTEDDELLSTEE